MSGPFHSSLRGNNLEALAWEFAFAAARAIGRSDIDRATVPPAFEHQNSPLDPQEIWRSRHP